MNGKAVFKIKVLKELEIERELGGEEIANLFWELDEVQQSEFFNELGEFERLPFQLNSVSCCESLRPDGRYAMSRIGEYATK